MNDTLTRLTKHDAAPVSTIDLSDDDLELEREHQESIKRRQTQSWLIVGRTKRSSLVQFRHRRYS